MGRMIGEKLGEMSPRHPSPRAAVPGPPIYLDAKDKDLPYDGYFKRTSRGPDFSYFDQPLGLREEGAMLLAILTGVQGSPLQKLAPGMPGFSLLYGVGRDGTKESPRHGKLVTADTTLNLSLRLDAVVGLNANEAMRKPKQKLQKVNEPVDECVDTMDLEEALAEKEPEGASKSWLFATAEEEELYKFTQDLDEKAHAGKELSLKEYLSLVRKSAGRLGARTQMLQDLCLAEDVDLGVTDLPAAPPPPPPPKPGTQVANSEKTDDSTKPKPSKDPYVGAMCATSLVVKKARRLAGLMHTEQQTIDLRDVWDWLQRLGAIAPPESRSKDEIREGGGSGGKGKQEEQKLDWRLPTSPAMALLYAQEDLRQRLAHLYQEKNSLETRKLQLTAAKKLVGKVSEAEEAKLRSYIHGLQTLEEGYETLGGKIADNLDDAQNLDKRFQELTEEARASKKGKKKKKGQKKGLKGRKGKKQQGQGGDENADDISVRSESEESDGGIKKKGKSQVLSAAEMSTVLVTEHKATSPIVSSPRAPGSDVSTMDQACQTDDAALFSLMEKMFSDMEEEEPVEPEDEATELRRLRRENKKLKVQLRFWRSRNWIEHHQNLVGSENHPTPVDPMSSEAGFSFYLDSLKPTIPSMDVARGGPDDAPSSLSGHGFPPPVQRTGQGTSSSAPSTFHPLKPVHTAAPPPPPPPPPPLEHQPRPMPLPVPSAMRPSHLDTQRQSNALHVRLMANAQARGPRSSRGSSVRPQEPPQPFPPDSLVIFGRSSQLLTPRESTIQPLPQLGNITPRRSGMQHQKA